MKKIIIRKFDKTFVKFFAIIFLALFITSTTAFTLFYRYNKKQNLLSIIDNEEKLINLQKEEFIFNLNSVISDLLFLSQQNELISLLENDTEENRNEIALEYLNLSKNKQIYDQIRYLNIDGKEVIRINYNNGYPKIVPEGKLQSKKNRYYFINAISLEPNEVYISQLDLNIEEGEIEHPIKPTIRFGTPIFDSQKNKRGVIVLNYLAGEIIEKVKNIVVTSSGHFELLNSDSYWIFGEDPEANWGFMYDDKKDINFQNKFPEEWKKISSNKSGHLVSEDNIFMYDTVSPFENLNISKSDIILKDQPSFEKEDEVYFWKIISHIKSDKIIMKLFDTFIRVYLLLVILLIIIAYLISKLLINRKISEDIKIEFERRSSVLAMVVTANHEINQPLTALKGNFQLFTKTIDENSLTDKQKKYLDKVTDSSDKICSILAKFREAKDIHFTDYLEDIKMVSFDEEIDG